MNSTLRASALSLAIIGALLPTAADAACTRLGFSVNDYGKEGPARDAQALLDKHIAQWAAERGIKKYRVGPKEVTCELYINLIIFDEHTCKAEANVCWEGKEIPDPLPAKSTPAKSTPAKKQ